MVQAVDRTALSPHRSMPISSLDGQQDSLLFAVVYANGDVNCQVQYHRSGVGLVFV